MPSKRVILDEIVVVDEDAGNGGGIRRTGSFFWTFYWVKLDFSLLSNTCTLIG